VLAPLKVGFYAFLGIPDEDEGAARLTDFHALIDARPITTSSRR
jgi:hypothetical protein